MKKYLLSISFFLAAVLVFSQSKHSKRHGRASFQGVGIELPIGIMNSKIDLPPLLQGQIPAVEGGIGYDLGLGLTYDNERNLNLRGGFHTWNSPFKPTVYAEEGNENEYVIEDGNLTYFGIYSRLEWGNDYFFIGTGIDFSFFNSYKADRFYYRNNSEVDRENNVRNSILTNEFSNQVYVKANVGFKIPIDRYIIKPFFAIGASFSSIYPTPKVTTLTSNSFFTVRYDQPQTVDLQFVPTFNYGVSFEYTL